MFRISEFSICLKNTKRIKMEEAASNKTKCLETASLFECKYFPIIQTIRLFLSIAIHIVVIFQVIATGNFVQPILVV